MKHHYWEAPIVIYLFLGGLGGGIFFLSALFDLIIVPGSGPLFFAPVFFALAALALGCFFLVFELGQPPVFWRVFTTKTAIIKWGAVLLSVAMIFGFVWWLTYLPVLGWGRGRTASLPPRAARRDARRGGHRRVRHHGLHRRHALHTEGPCLLGDAGAAGPVHRLGALHGLRGHRAFHRSARRLTLEGLALLLAELIHEIVHTVDIVLVVAEIVVLLVMVLSFYGAGNVCAHEVATRWVRGKTAPCSGAAWSSAVCCCRWACTFSVPALPRPALVAAMARALRRPASALPVRVLRQRAPIPGENRFWERLPKNDAAFSPSGRRTRTSTKVGMVS